jgi:hypothetical protein
MGRWVEYQARVLFRTKILFFRKPIMRARTKWLRCQGMHIGRSTLMPHCHVTWPHQVRLGSACRVEHNVYFH